MGNKAGKFLKMFDGSSPLVPQILIGIGCLTLRPTVVLTNKKEDPEKRFPAAARLLATELIAFPIALFAAKMTDKLGQALCKNSINMGATKVLFQTTGFIAANFIIPPTATLLLHKVPIKEKLTAFALNRMNKDVKPVTPAKVGFASFKNSSINIYNKTTQFKAYSSVKPYSETLKV